MNKTPIIETELPSPPSSTSSTSQSGINLQENARTKVSSWLSGLVEEVRKKSHGSMQKWTDNSTTSTSTSSGAASAPPPVTSATETVLKDDIKLTTNSKITIEITDQNEILKISEDETIKNCDKIDNSIDKIREQIINEKHSTNNKYIIKDDTKKNITWSKDTLFTKFSNSFDKSKTHFDFKTASQFSNFSKAKINEFYDRVRINKIKLQKMDDIGSSSSSRIDGSNIFLNNDDDRDEHSIPENNSIVGSNENRNFLQKSDDNNEKQQHNDNDPIKLEESIDDVVVVDDDYDEDDDPNINRITEENYDYTSFGKKLNLRDTNTSEILNSTRRQRRRRGSNLENSSTNNSLNLGYIGRSFSEANDDDEDDDLYLLNERSRSCSHVINSNQSMMMIMDNNDGSNSTINNNNNNNNNVSHSLPSFFEKQHYPLLSLPSSSSSTASVNPLLMNMIRSKKMKTKKSPPPLSSHTSNLSDKLLSSSDNPTKRNVLLRDSSVQSDSSHCSSVESLLESRRPDPEAILINLGFGPVESEDILSRIPKRFLKPSQVRGIDTEAFLRRQQLANHLHDHSVLGYRGLVGNPDIPPSTIVAKIMERFEQNERNRCIMDINMNRPQSAPPGSPNSFH